jgi:hypothetical protein
MRVTFPRLPDHAAGYSVVERDDGVVYQLRGSRAGTELPHDLRHLIVERELGIADGLWGGIASGIVYRSMEHVRGRRPPHAAERSADMKRVQRDRVLLAELLANLVEAVAALDDPSQDQIRLLTRTRFSILRITEPGTDPADFAPSPEALAAAASALQVEAARWARLRPGDELQYEWRHAAPRAVSALRSVPRQRAATGSPAQRRRGQGPGRPG